MENSLYIALSRQTTLWRQLDMVSNNLANMNTVGFKGSNPLFTEYLAKTTKEGSLLGEKISYTQDFGTVQDFSEGPIKTTNNPLDVAIHGDGYFSIEAPEGERFTRNGQFKLDNEGKIVTSSGYPVLSEQDQPFFIAPNETNIEIAKDGTVSTENGVIGKMKIVGFDNMQKMVPTHSGLFVAGKNNEINTDVEVQVLQGSLEESNVQPVVEMTKLIDLNRGYGHVQRMIEQEHDRQKDAINKLSQRPRA